jgi:uncharacterized SAM-binding protein YcdF (DUF218 family)
MTNDTSCETRNEAQQEPSHAPVRRHWRRRLLRWAEHVLAACALLFILLFLSPIPRWLHAAMDCQDELRHAKYIICLGGAPARVLEGARLLNEGLGDRLIVSNNEEAAPMMRDLAIDWGAPADKILLDDQSTCTADHPGSIQQRCNVDPTNDACIIVTSFPHMLRSKACFEKAGYRNIIMREPRWERQFRRYRSWRSNIWAMPELAYEYAAIAKYWLAGRI